MAEPPDNRSPERRPEDNRPPGLLGRLGFGAGRLDPETEAEQEASRQALEAGGLPVAAQRRLGALSSGAPQPFSSDLSVSEFAVLSRLGLEPITQVMGASIFQPGWQGFPAGAWYGGGGVGGYGYGRGWVRELTQVSDSFNLARRRALARLSAEAELAGADAVVGVRLGQTGDGFAGPGTVEFTAIGTAVRLPDTLRTGRAVISDLSGQDYVKLAQNGYRPAGVVGDTTIMYVASSYQQSWVIASGNSPFSSAGRANQELPDFTQGFYEAREVAMSHLNRQAIDLSAHGIVGVSFQQHIRAQEYDAGGTPHRDLIVTIHVLGTAITEGHPPLPRAELRTVMPLRRPPPRASRPSTRLTR